MQHRGIGKATVQAKIKRNLAENLDVMGNAELIFLITNCTGCKVGKSFLVRIFCHENWCNCLLLTLPLAIKRVSLSN